MRSRRPSCRPDLLELEITESMMMENPERAAETLHEIKEMGVHVSIDDFGTGYSSLARLKKFPIESVKIDRSFIRDIAIDSDDAAIVVRRHRDGARPSAQRRSPRASRRQTSCASCASAAATKSRASISAGRSRRATSSPLRAARARLGVVGADDWISRAVAPRRRESRPLSLIAGARGIPAFAGMTSQSSRIAAQVRGGEPQVVEHRPQRQDRGDPQRDGAEQRRRDAGNQRLVQQQRDDRRHLRDGLDLADERDGDALRLAELPPSTRAARRSRSRVR